VLGLHFRTSSVRTTFYDFFLDIFVVFSRLFGCMIYTFARLRLFMTFAFYR
jgi:hypothetical protein